MDDTALNKRPSETYAERQASTHVSFTLPPDPPAKPGDPSPYKVNLSTEYSKALLVTTKSEKVLKKVKSTQPQHRQLSPLRVKEETAQPDTTFVTGVDGGGNWTSDQMKYIEQYRLFSLESLVKAKNAMILALQRELSSLKTQLEETTESSKKISGNSLFLV